MACVAAERPVVAPRLGGMRASTATTWPEEPSSRRWCSTDQRMNLLKLASSTIPVVSTDTTEAVVYLRNEQQLGVVRSKQVCTTRRNASHTHLQNLMLVTG